MILIGFCGRAGVGKDTAAMFLVKDYQFRRVAFADELKSIARRLGWDGKKDDRGRKLLQLLGTEVGRGYDPDVWVNCVARLVKSYPVNSRFVFTDVRFPNEAEWLTNNGGHLFQIMGKGYDLGGNQAHASEKHAETLTLNTIDNTTDKQDFKKRVFDTIAPIIKMETDADVLR